MSYYTKYRPQTIQELDLDSVRVALQTVLTSGKFSHAYLFSGSKGTGKTSSARILAKVLNCEKNLNVQQVSCSTLQEPCNECDSCKRITNGSSLGCVEMDAASNRGIDDIRSLRERIGLAPAEGRFMVYIIDEVHMLTTEAFNALLKTLEEPPEHAIFFLCTTDPQKIPDTVISRCTRVVFKKATTVEVVKSLTKAIVGENLELESGVIDLIAARVDGSFRDGMKTLEQLAQKGGKITKTMVDELMGYGEDYAVDNLISALISKDITTALQELTIKQELGADAQALAKRLVESLRAKTYNEIVTSPSTAYELVKLTKHISQAVTQIKQSVFPFLPLELAVAEWCLEGTEYEVRSTKKETEKVVEKKTQTQVVTTEKIPEKVVVVQKKVVVDKVMETPLHTVHGAFTGTFHDILAKWQDILSTIRPYNHSLEALLRSARPHSFENGWLTIEAFYKFHKEQLEQDRYRRKVEEVVSQVMGGMVQLQFKLGNRVGASDSKLENISGSVEDEALVKAAEEIFGK